ncbi:aldose epimerase family protein [Plastorhodobacter daqingensis]|uniref:Aldose epimerase family protein n=1 Tax=Plastorhodobacter daqingensis TaxID=1387281 RepID=A0ABW2UIZ4_9RHOB
MTVRRLPFGITADGRPVEAVHLQAGELRAVVLTWGAVVQDLRLAGTPWPLALGSDQLQAYEGVMDYFGAVVGPVANRIAGAEARIAGRPCRFEANDGQNCLHGGTWGSQRQIWEIEAVGPDRLTLVLRLADGHGGFPGNRVIRAAYLLESPARMTLRLMAQTDAPTLMNLASHIYWNLDGRPDIAGHHLQVAADHYLPTRNGLPIGEIAPVTGAFDLRSGRSLTLEEQFDHNWCLARSPRDLTQVAELRGTKGVRLQLETTEPGLQVFDGATLDTRPFIGHAGQPYGPHAGIALEPQRWPDAPHHPEFPPVTLDAGASYTQTTRFTLSRS